MADGLIRRFLIGLSLLVILAAVAAVLAPAVSGALVRALTWGTLVAAGVSVLLSRVVWENVRWLPGAWRSPGSPARALAGAGRKAARCGHSRPRPAPTDADAHRFARALLLILIVSSLLWIAWQTPGPWQEGMVIAVTLPLAAGKRPRWGRTALAGARRFLAAPAQRCTRRSGALSRLQREWAGIPAARRTTIRLLVLLNALTTLAVLDTARMSAGLPVTHAALAFAVMVCVNLALMNASRLTARVKPGSARQALSPVEPTGAAPVQRPPHHRHPNGSHPHPGTQGTPSERRPASLATGPADKP